jgi:indolepyruvate ferredoxin oxidoreductase
VQPLETEFGRKRQIDQSNCNKDFSCVEGFCPSFVTVHGGRPKQAVKPAVAVDSLFANLPVPPPRPLEQPYNILIAGIGGTGVITIGALLGMAAHLEGKGCSALDFTGLAQKNGAVMSHVRIAARPEDIAAVRIAAGGADLLLGCDIVVSASPAGLSRAEFTKTRAVINADLQPTASFVIDPDIDFEIGAMQRVLRDAVGDEHLDIVDATGIATALLGDSIATNAFMLGFAFQKGLIPLSLEAICKAIELNGAAVEMNTRAFNWGRLAAADIARVREAARFRAKPERQVKTLDEAIAYRSAFLGKYQNNAYAARYLQLVAAVRKAESAALPGSTELTEAVAKNLFKLMAYKDEYEVARLYADPAFAKKVRERFDGDFRLSFHLAPPLLARRDPSTGRLQKREYGAWMMPAFRLLARLKFLRGTAFDPFGHTSDRKAERALIADYEAAITRCIAGLRADRIAALARLARLPEMIRGYGHIKEDAIRKFTAERARVEADIENGSFAVAAE